MSGLSERERPSQPAPPPATLTFLAPSERCNQHCPNCYITEVANEPVQSFDLTPADYALFVKQFVDAGVSILSVKFQGYEVTLPRSWPYLEAVFKLAQEHGIRRGFITNGMLLHRWTDRIRALDPARITISLDGASPEANDPARGLVGAFRATTTSLRRFLESAPEFRDRVSVASVLRGQDNFPSLLEMPRLLRSLGVTRWLVSLELGLSDQTVGPVVSTKDLLLRFAELQRVAEQANIRFHASDEAGSLPSDPTVPVRVHRPPHPRFFYRPRPFGRSPARGYALPPLEHGDGLALEPRGTGRARGSRLLDRGRPFAWLARCALRLAGGSSRGRGSTIRFLGS